MKSKESIRLDLYNYLLGHLSQIGLLACHPNVRSEARVLVDEFNERRGKLLRDMNFGAFEIGASVSFNTGSVTRTGIIESIAKNGTAKIIVPDGIHFAKLDDIRVEGQQEVSREH